MPYSIIPQDQDGKNIFNAISAFFRVFMIGKFLHKCNVQKEKGVPVLDIFKYKLCNIFSGRSMYMQQRTGSYLLSLSEQCKSQLDEIYILTFQESCRCDRASYE